MSDEVTCRHCQELITGTETYCAECQWPVHARCFRMAHSKSSVAPTPGPCPFPLPDRRREGADSDVPRAAEPAGDVPIFAPEMALVGTIISYPNGHKLIVAGLSADGNLLVLPYVLPYDDRGIIRRIIDAFKEWRKKPPKPTTPRIVTWPGKDKVDAL